MLIVASEPDKPAPASLAEAKLAQPAPKPAAKPPVPAKDEPFVIKRILPIKGAIKYGEWHWNEHDVPPARSSSPWTSMPA
ncbi:hypothetical protein ACFSLT_02335 [Novosphingobium resinovorum]